MIKIGNTSKTLNKSKVIPNDEIFTHIDEIKEELVHYVDELRGKVIYCNCDNENSAFYEYFVRNFDRLGIKHLFCTSIDEGGIMISYDGKETVKKKLSGNGSFSSEECIELLKMSDITITNPPFSIIHDFLDLIIGMKKKYLIIGPVTAFQNRHLKQVLNGEFGYGYKDSNKCRMKYKNTDKTYGNHCWLTNLRGDGKKLVKEIKKGYDMSSYLFFDDSDILYIDRGDRIPFNYSGVIAISKTYIVGMFNPKDKLLHVLTPIGEIRYKIVGFGKGLKINGKNIYDRILIQKV